MNGEEFQNIVLQELKSLNSKVDKMESKFTSKMGLFEDSQKRFENRQKRFEDSQKRMEVRQDEIFQVVRAIEHSNNVGRSELDSQNIRLAKVEGKFKKVAKALNEDIEVDKVSNL